MNRKELLQFCEQLPDASYDQPFDDPDLITLRHKSNQKWFGLLLVLHGEDCVNVKASPYDIDGLCDMYKGIQPGWHMNKRHWITITLNSDVSDEEIKALLQESYELTSRKTKKKS